ncbi:MAG: CpsD/CapB family tyrosine-protein kinase, partial [Oscillospiraceae bacterium]|nr:CpsD/CapB family tyrosine-protein kinase [Oscillospiraceae bacterium]
IGIALGLVFAICYIIIAAYMDSTIHGKNEIMACFNIPIIGNIPMSEKEEQEKKKHRLFGKKKDNFDIFGRNLVINEKTPFAITEAYKKARTNVFYLPIEGNCHKIVLTSALAAEGKTVASINITKLLAQAGKRVLLIDADMRNPKVSRYLGLDEQAGLSEYLAGICPVAEVLQNDAIGADVIVSGKSSSSAAELLATARMDLLLEEKENDYDYIIIDTPPINIVTDSLILADKVNGYLIGVRAEYSNTVSLKQAVTSLEQVDANILGVILINTDPKVEEYGQYGAYSKYHAYRYNYNNDYNPAEFNENSATGENNKKNRNRYERRS